MFAPLLLVYVALFEEPPRAAIGRTAPAFVVCAALAVLSRWMAPAFVPGGTSRWHYLLTQPFVIAHYLATFVLPIRLSADTDWVALTSPIDYRVAVGALTIAGVLAIAATAAKRRETRPIAFGLLWFLIALLPTSSIIPLAEVLNDHRMYFPFVGLTLAAAASAQRLAARWRVPAGGAAAVACVMLLAMAWGTHRRNNVWRTEESLWLDVTQKSPCNGRGLMTYGVIQMGKENYAAADDYFQRALALAPEYSYLHVNIAILDGARGRYAEAEEHFRAAQRFDPDNPVSYFFYARWLTQVGRVSDALLQAKRAVDLSPGYADAQDLLRFLKSRPR